jgi:hypothetical protein
MSRKPDTSSDVWYDTRSSIIHLLTMKSATLQCYTVLAWRFANRLISKDFFAAKNRWRRECPFYPIDNTYTFALSAFLPTNLPMIVALGPSLRNGVGRSRALQRHADRRSECPRSTARRKNMLALSSSHFGPGADTAELQSGVGLRHVTDLMGFVSNLCVNCALRPLAEDRNYCM